jgi:hypothetical protein
MSDPEGFSTYEVTLPEGVNEQSLALFGLGNAFGWNIKQRVTLMSDLEPGATPESMVISDQDLLYTSHELWGNTDVGETAANLLSEIKCNFVKIEGVTAYRKRGEDQVTISSNLQHRYGDEPGDFYESFDMITLPSHRFVADSEKTQTAVQDAIGKLWPRVPYPFEAPRLRPGLPTTDPSPWLDAECRWGFIPGAVTRVRLAHYVRTKGIDHHECAGSVGRTLDVLTVAAGLKSPDQIEPKPPLPDSKTIAYKEFQRRLRSSGLSKHAQAEIRQEIDWSLEEQLDIGKVAHWRPSVDVEGKGSWLGRGGQYKPYFEAIALHSLATLFDIDRLSGHQAGREFLSQFAKTS